MLVYQFADIINTCPRQDSTCRKQQTKWINMAVAYHSTSSMVLLVLQAVVISLQDQVRRLRATSHNYTPKLQKLNVASLDWTHTNINAGYDLSKTLSRVRTRSRPP